MSASDNGHASALSQEERIAQACPRPRMRRGRSSVRRQATRGREAQAGAGEAGVTRGWWDERAARLQDGVRASDARDAAGFEVPISAFETRKAVTHTRQDIVMLVSLASSLNAQAQTIKRLLIAVVVLLAYLAIRA